MELADLRLAQARWVLGRLAPERLIEIACEALAAGIDSDALRALAGESAATRECVGPQLARTLRELGLNPLDESEARFVLARSWARRIVSGEIAPYEGAKGIGTECCESLGGEAELDVFLRLASEHEDFRFAEESAPGRYADDIARCEREIRDAARMLFRRRASSVDPE